MSKGVKYYIVCPRGGGGVVLQARLHPRRERSLANFNCSAGDGMLYSMSQLNSSAGKISHDILVGVQGKWWNKRFLFIELVQLISRYSSNMANSSVSIVSSSYRCSED